MTAHAYRVRVDGLLVYVTPFEDRGGRRILYEQDPSTFETERRTVDAETARTLAERGREVALAETPAWCDARVPRAASAPVQPS